jgi:N-acetylglucosamine kinase-like BadF-type ATPase
MGNAMRYILGIDGGNSKTHALITDERGVPSGFGKAGASDYQEVGIEQAEQAWSMAIHLASDQAGTQPDEITAASFCLAGADLPEDYVLLQKTVGQLLPQAKVKVKNDTIAALRAGLYESSYGVTVVVGTGFNAAGRSHRGQEIVMPGLGYLSGDYGGGRWLGRQVIRAVMRAWDGRGLKTTLSRLVLNQMGVNDEPELIRLLRCADDIQGRILGLVPLVFEAAYQGDAVARSFLVALGEEVGLTASVLIHRLGLENESVPVVLSTSVFRGKGPLLLEVITKSIHRTAPLARVVIPEFLPVVGAVLEAMDDTGICLDKTVFENLRHGILDRFPTLIRPNGTGGF